MEVTLTIDKPIFDHAHELGKTDCIFVGANFDKLAKQGLSGPSDQSQYVTATVVVRKRDLTRTITNQRQCGDSSPVNTFTELDRYPLPAIEDIFQELQGATIFSKSDLRSGYHHIPLAKKDEQNRVP